MEEIISEVKSYDIKTLREKLSENGVKVGPIAPAAISLFQKRLISELCRVRGIESGDTTVFPNKLEKLGSAEQKEISNSESKEKSIATDVYYAVCLPGSLEQEVDSPAQELVFSDKDLALKTAKKYKGSRFKVFKTEHDAKCFSRLTAESAFQSPRRPSQEESVQEVLATGESSPFKAPKPQELAQLRKTVEKGDVEAFRQQVWDNPRFLVSSGDTPAMFQEGPRYTAMHVAATKNKPEICQVILDILEDPVFVNKLYGQSKNTEETQNSRINFLVDLYLNMPDKGNCESPLHMACKYGHAEVVEVLAAHPRTDKLLRNKYGDTPKDLVCSRCTNVSGATKKRIEELLQGQCYVPLMRYEDNTAPPVVGQPWSPDINKASLDVPVVTNSPRDPSLTIRACAGPMSPTDAGLFHKRWTTPPSQSPELTKAYINKKRGDSEKGMERIGRQLARELHVQWSEYWEFLDQFVDMSTPSGLDILENYFKKRVWFNFIKDFKEKHGITEQMIDHSNFSTSLGSCSKPSKLNNLNESFESDIFQNRTDDDNRPNSHDKEKQYKRENSVSENGSVKDKKDLPKPEDVQRKADCIVSPMTNLSQHFSKLKLDESWSDMATIDSADKTVDSDASGETDTKEEVNKSIPDFRRTKSAGSDSTASYKTAVEEPDDSSVSDFGSPPSSLEAEMRGVCFVIKDMKVFETLVDEMKTSKDIRNAKEIVQFVNFIVHVKGDGNLLNIVSIPSSETVLRMVLLENVEVEKHEGDLSKAHEGDLVEIRSVDEDADKDDSVILAYLTQTHSLPKVGYIYGPQPTREDLNVSRALGDATLSPECHPNVFHWKISLSKFLKDTNYRWQSPAKLKPRIRQASPIPSPLGMTSPVIPYGSPLATRAQPTNPVTSNIRTRLFPAIVE